VSRLLDLNKIDWHSHCVYRPRFVWVAALVICLPLWFRLLQSLRRHYDTRRRHPALSNAIKYGISMSVVLFGVFNPAYSRSLLQGGRGPSPYEIAWIDVYTTATIFTWLWWVDTHTSFPGPL
jgi:xenotropic and polytropic retrovirus receptor 1